jgi:bla regulator protein BlaR1
MNSVGLGTILWVFGAYGGFAQPTATSLTFEVASVKPSAQNCEPDGSCPAGFKIQHGGGLRVTGASLELLVTFAYDVRNSQVSGGPAWINSDRFDIDARAEHSDALVNLPADPREITDDQLKTSLDQVQERLRNLLVERFKLAVHRGAKEQQVYALVVAKNGPKLQSAKQGRVGMQTGRGLLNGRGVNLATFASALSDWAGRTVIDRTGLTGNYDIELRWTPDPGHGPASLGSTTPGGPPPPGVGASPPPDTTGTSLFSALQEQLGVRLESQKGPVETLVIDYVEKPSEN